MSPTQTWLMPSGGDRFRLDDSRGKTPVLPKAGKQDPEDAVPGTQLRDCAVFCVNRRAEGDSPVFVALSHKNRDSLQLSGLHRIARSVILTQGARFLKRRNSLVGNADGVFGKDTCCAATAPFSPRLVSATRRGPRRIVPQRLAEHYRFSRTSEIRLFRHLNQARTHKGSIRHDVNNTWDSRSGS
jgi:hypothetical protein